MPERETVTEQTCPGLDTGRARPEEIRLVIVITAPSGAGKTTVIRRLLESDSRLHYSVSATTRPRRDREVEGKDYFFLAEGEFRQRLEAGEFAEWAVVHDHLYGTLKSQIEQNLSAGRHVVMDVDVQGAEQLRHTCRAGVFIYLAPPSMEELERRLRSRGTEDPATLERRLANAREEIRRLPYFDYLVLNDDLERSVAAVRAIIEAEEHRVKRLADPYAVVRSLLYEK
ncbi:guanylate kinase [bacterium]|nr:guanylate kinase [bacterium]